MPEEKLMELMWWVFIKNACLSSKYGHHTRETQLFVDNERWMLPLIQEHMGADRTLACDIVGFPGNQEKYQKIRSTDTSFCYCIDDGLVLAFN